MAEVHISSLIVRHLPEQAAAVRAAAGALSGLDWHADQDGKAVVTLVTDSARRILDYIDALNLLPGVLGTTLVYHHYEDAEAIDGPAPDAALGPAPDAATAPALSR
ncbi:chaperone NapD [Azospirillum thermophilum]|uniref:Chaperone NapD n=1 Tax=Azospirillum thermophilum TaxID=2202148 RepID=A0A2S2CV99_9PROT|nr:chaperone NapD [Azospirillum thermophilum]AWK88421.1 nitrate reductase [Azospirillum thermophilum]